MLSFGCFCGINLFSMGSTKHKHLHESLHLHWVTFLCPKPIKIFKVSEYTAEAY